LESLLQIYSTPANKLRKHAKSQASQIKAAQNRMVQDQAKNALQP
jgi:hypothetical protein